jgi:hypothetical protein
MPSSNNDDILKEEPKDIVTIFNDAHEKLFTIKYDSTVECHDKIKASEAGTIFFESISSHLGDLVRQCRNEGVELAIRRLAAEKLVDYQILTLLESLKEVNGFDSYHH